MHVVASVNVESPEFNAWLAVLLGVWILGGGIAAAKGWWKACFALILLSGGALLVVSP